MLFDISRALWGLSITAGFAAAMTDNGYDGHGLIGYGIKMYNPLCAFACHDSISPSPLSCTMEQMDMDSMSGMSMDGPMTMPHCYATNDAFLQTLAWCISTHCNDLPVWKLEKYWNTYAVGRQKGQPLPKQSYQVSLAKVTEPPTETLAYGEPLNKTMLVSDADHLANTNGMGMFETMEHTHERYGLVVFLSGVVIPIGLSLLRFVPWPSSWITRFNAYFIYPPAFGSRHKTPVGGIANIPTRGQALFIAYLVAINVILCAVDIRAVQPNAWFASIPDEVLTYITDRAGVLSFANIPLLFLYAGRNNALLWLTNWSHGTFILLHRWIALIATIQACLHSAIFVNIYKNTYATESQLPYWYWGIIATLGMAILLPTSILPLRKKMYELFLAWHIAISILVIAGCYLHIIYRFEHQWGYQTWLLVSIAVWGFDRLMRVLRLARNGIKRAEITIIDDDYVRLDIPGVSGTGHAYFYFPTLTWRVWENHPFSVASGILLSEGEDIKTLDRSSPMLDPEKSAIQVTTLSNRSVSSDNISRYSIGKSQAKVGLTIYLRTQGGLTAQIRQQISLPVLIEADYGLHEDLSSHSVLIGIAGGVGITAVLPALQAFPGRTKLFWGLRSDTLVEEFRPKLVGIEKETFIGHRMNVLQCLEEELNGCLDKAVVLVSGPPGLADDVRMAVSKLGRNKAAITLVEESFSW